MRSAPTKTTPRPGALVPVPALVAAHVPAQLLTLVGPRPLTGEPWRLAGGFITFLGRFHFGLRVSINRRSTSRSPIRIEGSYRAHFNLGVPQLLTGFVQRTLGLDPADFVEVDSDGEEFEDDDDDDDEDEDLDDEELNASFQTQQSINPATPQSSSWHSTHTSLPCP